MGIEALGYIGVRAKDVGDWASYGQEQKRIEEALRRLREGR